MQRLASAHNDRGVPRQGWNTSGMISVNMGEKYALHINPIFRQLAANTLLGFLPRVLNNPPSEQTFVTTLPNCAPQERPTQKRVPFKDYIRKHLIQAWWQVAQTAKAK